MFQTFQVTVFSNGSTNLTICYKFNVNHSVEVNILKLCTCGMKGRVKLIDMTPSYIYIRTACIFFKAQTGVSY